MQSNPEEPVVSVLPAERLEQGAAKVAATGFPRRPEIGPDDRSVPRSACKNSYPLAAPDEDYVPKSEDSSSIMRRIQPR